MWNGVVEFHVRGTFQGIINLFVNEQGLSAHHMILKATAPIGPLRNKSSFITLHGKMAQVDDHLQCQKCLRAFESNVELRRHLKKFDLLETRIRTWDEQCRAHAEPTIETDVDELDDDMDELDAKLCTAFLGARQCPVEGCEKNFKSKKQLNIHFEMRMSYLLLTHRK